MRRPYLCLVLASPLLGCPGDDEASETGASTASTSAATSMGATDPTSAADASTSAGPNSTTTATTTSGSGDGSSSSGGGASPVDGCMAACEHLVKCGVEQVPNCGIPCGGIAATVAGCESEYLAQQACAVALSCADLQLWADAMGVGSDYPCAAEDDAFEACIGGGSG